MPWEASTRFSFVKDHDLAVLDIDPEGNEPSAATIRSVLKALADRTAHLRRAWWTTFGTVGLDGKWVRNLPKENGKPQFEILKRTQKDAARITSVTFTRDTGKLNFIPQDRGTFTADAGQRRDLSSKD